MNTRRGILLNNASGKKDLLAALPAIAIITLCCGLPLAWMIFVFASHPSIWADVHLGSFRMDLLARTLLYNFSAALLATAMGLPAGLAMGRGRGWIAFAMWFVIPAALFMPSLAFAYGWAELVRSMDRFFRPIGITFFPGSPSDILRCIWTLAAWLWSVPACIIGLALRRMDTSVQQQAALEGALFRITLRQLLPAIVVSIAAVTILATQEFSVYEPSGISVVATEVRMVFDTGAFSSFANPIAGAVQSDSVMSPDQSQRAASAMATAAPLLAVTMVLAAMCAWIATRSSASDELAVGTWPRALDAPAWTTVATLLLLGVNIVLPIISLLAHLHAKISPANIWREFSPKVLGSLLVALVAAGAGAVAALSASARWTRGLLVISALSFLIGGQLLAIGLIRISNRPAMLWAYDSLALPVAAYVGRFGWLAIAASRTTWSPPWRGLREMASLDGANVRQTATHIVWPLAWPGLLAGCIFLGALSLTEVPATVLLSPQNPQVLTPMLMTWVHSAHFDPMIEASLLMVALALLPVTIAIPLVWISRRRFRNQSASGRALTRPAAG